MIGFQVIPQGERVLVWNRNGQARIVDGPQRLALFQHVARTIAEHWRSGEHAPAGQQVASVGGGAEMAR